MIHRRRQASFQNPQSVNKEATPFPHWPRGLSRVQAAFYIGIGVTLFDEMIVDGRMPGPKQINRRKVWDRHILDNYFDQLPDSICDEINPWDEVDEGGTAA